MRLFSKKQSDVPRRRSIENTGANRSPSMPTIFKRNRTLTGSTSNQLNGINSKTDLESPRIYAHKLSIIRRKISGILLIVVVSMIPIWILISNLTVSVNVSSSDVSISKPIDKVKYEKIIQNYLDINPMSRLAFLLDQTDLNAYISLQLPEVSSVTQNNSISIGVSNFAITLREPVAKWQINNKYYYVDSKGIPFEVNYYSDPPVQIVDNSGISVKISTKAIASNRFLSFVGRVVYLAKAGGYTVTQAILPNDTTRELQIKLKECNYIVKLSIDRPAGEQVEDMIAAVRYFTNHGQSPQYIDVRVSGKAFYK